MHTLTWILKMMFDLCKIYFIIYYRILKNNTINYICVLAKTIIEEFILENNNVNVANIYYSYSIY